MCIVFFGHEEIEIYFIQKKKNLMAEINFM